MIGGLVSVTVDFRTERCWVATQRATFCSQHEVTPPAPKLVCESLEREKSGASTTLDTYDLIAANLHTLRPLPFPHP